ncbi:MAG: hypothetical protein PHQ36_02290 [Anaerolineales bacterium]|nr:hypothetical protein [Anaerolineales bacterium]
MFNLISPRMLPAWALSLPVAYFTLGYLGNYYSSFTAIILIAALGQVVFGLSVYRLLGKAEKLYANHRWDFSLALALFAALTVFVVKMFETANRFPRLFDAKYMTLEAGQTLPFMIGCAIAFPSMLWAVGFFKQRKFSQSRLYQFLDEISAGVLIAAFFFAFYFIFASIFNQPVFDVDDIFFDTDGLLWRRRFATPDFQDYYWRSVHPFALLIIRPLVALLAFFLKGDKLAAAFTLTAFAGALCVFLAWYFVKQTAGNSLYALLIASLFGASAAYIIFGFLLETYIFLAAAMMIFLVLLLKDKPLVALIFTGALSFGITLTNFVQTAIAFIFIKRDFKQWVKYGVIVGALVVPLALLNNFIYPKSQPYFFDPSSFNAEAENTFAPSVPRALAIARVMALHSIVAPDPLILDEEIPFLKVWIFKAEPMRLSEYKTWSGKILAFVWLGLILLGEFLFLKNLKKQDPRFSPAFIVILIFNFLLHLKYGKDLFLYSANWTYAIVLFLALAWRELAERKWFQIVLLVFIGALLANNSRLILTMLSTSALHVK